MVMESISTERHKTQYYYPHKEKCQRKEEKGEEIKLKGKKETTPTPTGEHSPMHYSPT